MREVLAAGGVEVAAQFPADRRRAKPEVRLPTAEHHPFGEGHSLITIGIDPQESSITAVAVNHDGTERGQIRIPVNGGLVRQLMSFAADWTARRWAVEGPA